MFCSTLLEVVQIFLREHLTVILFVPIVSLLYGDNPSYALSAAVLEHSVRKVKTKHDMVLMYTDDVEKV